MDCPWRQSDRTGAVVRRYWPAGWAIVDATQVAAGGSMELAEYGVRKGVRLASTWTIVAELLRHHGEARKLRVIEWHPGGGQYDGLALFTEDDAKPRKLGFFHTLSERLDVVGADGTTDAVVSEWPDGDRYALALLSAESPSRVVREAGLALGLPADVPVSPTNPSTACVRALAAYLRERAMDPLSLDVRSGWVEPDGGTREWIARFPSVRDAVINAPDGSWARVCAASRLWRIGADGSEHGVILDFASGKAFSSRADRYESLWNMYRERRSLKPLTRWISDQITG